MTERDKAILRAVRNGDTVKARGRRWRVMDDSDKDLGYLHCLPVRKDGELDRREYIKTPLRVTEIERLTPLGEAALADEAGEGKEEDYHHE